jgi:hemolysin activation/secretion protein
VSYPLMRTRANTIVLDGGLTFQDARVSSPALELAESRDKWRVADASVTYVNNGFLYGVSSATVGIAQGLGILGASHAGRGRSRPDGVPTFTKLTTTLRRTQLIDGPLTLFTQAVGQWSNRPLFAGEEIAFGGNQIARGFEPGAITGDSGIGGSAELRWDERLDDYYIENAQFYVFFDAATVHNRAAGQLSQGIDSTGIGVRLSLPQDLSLNFEFAHRLGGVPTTGNETGGSLFLFGAAIRF